MTYYLTTSGQVVSTSYVFFFTQGFRSATPTTLLPNVTDAANLTLYADYFRNAAGLAVSIGATQAGTDGLAQDASSNIGKILVTVSGKASVISGVHNVAGVEYYVDRSGTPRLAITDRGTANDELDSVVVDAPLINLGWPYKDGSQTVQSGTPSGTLVDPLLSLPRNAATGHVLVGSTIIGSSILLAYQDGSFYTVPTVALTSAVPLVSSVIVDRTAEFKPNTGSFGKIAFIRPGASAGDLYVMNTDGVLYLVQVPSGAL
jgi:hypothetical protein